MYSPLISILCLFVLITLNKANQTVSDGSENVDIEANYKDRIKRILFYYCNNKNLTESDLENLEKCNHPGYNSLLKYCEQDVYGENYTLTDKREKFCQSPDEITPMIKHCMMIEVGKSYIKVRSSVNKERVNRRRRKKNDDEEMVTLLRRLFPLVK